MPTATKLMSNVPVVQTFLEHFERDRPKLFLECMSIVQGKSTLEAIKTIAFHVGCREEIDITKPIVDFLNTLWPYITNFPQ